MDTDKSYKGAANDKDDKIRQYTERFYGQAGNAELITYDTADGRFSYSDVIRELFGIEDDSLPLWESLRKNEAASEETAEAIRNDIVIMCGNEHEPIRLTQYFLRSSDGMWRWYRLGYIPAPDRRHLMITLIDINEEILANRRLKRMADFDELTGLLTRSSFDSFVRNLVRTDPEGAASGNYAIIVFDILRFKAINDMFGQAEGDRLLIYIANVLLGICGSTDTAGRMNADRFAVFLDIRGGKLERLIDIYFEALEDYDLAFKIVSNLGIYVLDGEKLSPDAMLDRATLAQASIKGSYTQKYCYYNESLRSAMLSEQEITGTMNGALSGGQFTVYYQPQYDVTGDALVGAEALVRWRHPERGMLMPAAFIPIFEKNGFITKLDLYVFDHVCEFLGKCLDRGVEIVPISVNFTRYDIFQHDFVEKLEKIRARYDIPVEYVRIEITETAAMGSVRQINEIISRLHAIGYIVEMDDFGSGYSSLNVLKDINIDYLKLDMSFLADDVGNNRSGIILSSVVRMVRWLDLPIIAEGVKNVNQAEFLRSIGCNYVQGFLYAKPMEEDRFEEMIVSGGRGSEKPQNNFIDVMDAGRFWDPESLDTLIFNKYVGPAAIFDYYNNRIDSFRVNQKYLEEIGGILSEKEYIEYDGMKAIVPEDRHLYVEALRAAIETGKEQECECWRCYSDDPAERMCIRSTLRLLGKSDQRYLFFASIRNVTAEKLTYSEILHRERLFRMAQEQANIYYWEYDVATKEMRPCYRCMRDLGLSPVMFNYPEPVIDMGIFPQDVADRYREMHRQIENGAKELSADMPLTANREMFHIRYTTEFDDKGRPVKAYGSATHV